VLYLRRPTPFLSQQAGGGQERQRRSGTEDVAGIVGTATALRLAEEEREVNVCHCQRLRDRLIEGVLASIPRSYLTGHSRLRLAKNAHFAFEDVDADKLLARLDALGIAASSGSACTSSVWEPSHVLVAMGVPLTRAVGSLRLTLGADNTDEEIDYLLSILPGIVEKLRREPLPAAHRSP
jgi:cysteine desulfurase